MNVMKNNGSALIEFALTIVIFLLMIFSIFEFGMMLSIKNGLQAGLFYTVRHSATQENTFDILKDTFVSKYTEYAFGNLDKATITIVKYDSLSDRAAGTNPLSITNMNQENNSSEIYLFNVDAPYTYITSFFQAAGTTATIKLQGTVYNEEF